MRTPNVRRWLGLSRLWDYLAVTGGQALADAWAVFANDKPRKQRGKPPRAQLELAIFEPRFHPGTMLNVTGFGQLGVGLAFIDRALTGPAMGEERLPPVQRSEARPASVTAGASRLTANDLSPIPSAQTWASQRAAPVATTTIQPPAPPRAWEYNALAADPLGPLFADPLADAWGWADAGRSRPPAPPVGPLALRPTTTEGGTTGGIAPQANPAPPFAWLFADSRKQDSGVDPGSVAPTPASAARPSAVSASSAITQPTASAPQATPAPPSAGAQDSQGNQGGDQGNGHHGRGNDPMWILDANKAVVVTPGTPENEFSNWTADMRAQVSGATVSTYSWTFTSAPDATSITGSTTYRAQWTWGNFTGATRTDTVVVTETPTVGSAITQTLTFKVASTSSPAYTASAPTSSSTWPVVLPPDAVTAGQATTGGGPYYALGQASGELDAMHAMPGYNPGVPALMLDYNSVAANPLPIFIDHFQIDPSQAVPATVSAQLTFNGVLGSTFYYSTSSLNPGDTMQIALQGDATGLSTGRYSYSVAVTANYGTPVTTTTSGSVDIINSSTSPFGAGWSLSQLERIWPVTGGAILEQPGGTSLWFANGQTSGTFVTPAGDFSTLTQNTQTNVYTRTMTDGTKIYFDSTGKQSSVVDRVGNTFTDNWDGSNRLTSIGDPNGLAVTLAYDGNNRVTTFTDPAARVTSLSYDGSGRPTAVTDPDSAAWGYSYDSSSRMTVLTNPRSYSTTFTYNFAGRVSGVTRPDTTTESMSAMQMQGLVQAGQGTQGNPATGVLAAQAQASYTDPRNDVWAQGLDWLGFGLTAQASDPLADLSTNYLDANGLAWLSADQLGRRTRSFFDGSGNTTKLVQQDDTTRQYTYNGFAEPTKFTDETGGISTYNYDSSGDLASQQDILGHLTSYTYNAKGFVSTVTDPLSRVTSYALDSRNRVTSTRDALGNLVTAGFDGASNQTLSVDQRGNPTTYTFDQMGRQTQQALPDSNPNNHPVYTTIYDAAGNAQVQIDPLGLRTTTSFDALNRVTSVRDALNRVTTYHLDNGGNQIAVTDPTGATATSIFDTANRLTATADQLNHRVTYTLDAAGQRTVTKDAVGSLLTMTYTSRGQLQTQTDAVNNELTYSYDNAGYKTVEDHGDATGGGGGFNPTQGAGDELTTYTFDNGHQNTSMQDANGNLYSYQYDPAGNRTLQLDPLSHRTTYSFDALNRVSVTKDGLGDVTTVHFDSAGNKTAVIDPLGRITSYNFDAQNRLTSVVDPRGGITSYGYDVDGRQTSITDSVGNTTSYSLDGAGRVTTITDPFGHQSTYVYDNAGRVTDETDRDGRRRVFVFDNAGNRTAEEWLNAQGQVTSTMTYQYDANNRLTSEQDPNSSYAFTYDGIGELTKVDNLGTPNAPRMWLTFAYDAFGNVLKITDSSSGGFPAISYGYDQDNNLALAQFKTFGNGRARLYYDQSDRLTTVTRDGGNGGASISTVWSYDNADRVTGITHSSSSAGALATFTYGWDNASQLTSYTGPEGSLTYTYDNASDLTGVGNARSENYSYDLNGNRNMTGWSTGGNNRLTGDGTFTYAYDNEGNLLSKTRLSDTQQWTFTWDYRNRLTQAVVKTSAGVTVANDVFTYDVEDQRIGKSTNGTQTWTFYKDHNPYADFNSGGALVYRYLYGNGLDQLLGRDDGTASKWYLTDNIGSVRLFVTTAGTILDQLTYDSYGNILTETNSANGDRFKYTARDWDSEIGLQYNRARYYDPKAGRWISLDPLSFSAGDLDLYRYAHNDPTNADDPTGLAGPAALPPGDLLEKIAGNMARLSELIKHYQEMQRDADFIARKLVQDPTNPAFPEWAVKKGDAAKRAFLAIVVPIRELYRLAAAGEAFRAREIVNLCVAARSQLPLGPAFERNLSILQTNYVKARNARVTVGETLKSVCEALQTEFRPLVELAAAPPRPFQGL
jgi:RHS repeat-associated protein